MPVFWQTLNTFYPIIKISTIYRVGLLWFSTTAIHCSTLNPLLYHVLQISQSKFWFSPSRDFWHVELTVITWIAISNTKHNTASTARCERQQRQQRLKTLLESFTVTRSFSVIGLTPPSAFSPAKSHHILEIAIRSARATWKRLYFRLMTTWWLDELLHTKMNT